MVFNMNVDYMCVQFQAMHLAYVPFFYAYHTSILKHAYKTHILFFYKKTT